MAYIYNLIDTWNNAGTTFTAIKMNVTDTNSSASSLLMDLQVGTVSQFNVRKDGSIYTPNGIVAMGVSGAGPLYISTNSSAVGYNMASGLGVGWTNSATNAVGAPDTILRRDAAATLAQRNSTNAQTYRLYGTYTDASNYERGYMTTDSNGFTIGTEALGTGTKRPVRIIGPSLASAESVSALELSQTWNTSGTPTALKINITNTASAAGSLLMDLQAGGVRRVGVFANYTSYVGAVSILNTTSSTVGTLLVEQDSGSGTLGVRRADNGNAAGIKSSFWEEGSQSAARVDVSGFSTGGSRFYGFGASNANSPDTYITRRGIANLRLGSADVGASPSTVTITIATPGVVTWNDHRLSTGTPVVFTTTGALPTGITSGTTYYVVVVSDNTFQLATSVANAIAATPTVITTSGTQSGTHTATRYNITQRLSMQGVTGVTDRLGADLFIQGSQGTGTGAGGSIIFQVAPATTNGSTPNALQNAFAVRSDGAFLVGPGVNSYIENPAYYGIGLNCVNNNGFWVSLNGHSGTFIGNNTPIGWSASTSQTGIDLKLFRDDANKLALRNSTAAQTFNIYDTYTDVSNYRRTSMYWSGGVFYIDNDLNAGTGITNATMYIKTRGNLHLLPGAGGYDVVTNGNSAGAFYPGGTTNTTNLGRSDKTFAIGYFGTSVVTPQVTIPLQTLTDGANVAWNCNNGAKAKVTLGGNRTINAVTNAVEGTSYTLWVIQDATGSRTVTWTTSGAGSFDFGTEGTPVLTTTASAADALGFEAISIGGTLKLRFMGIKRGFA